MSRRSDSFSRRIPGSRSWEASLDLLIRSSAFYFDLCGVTGTNWASPKNPGKIDKRQPMWVPFMAEMKRIGPLTI